MSRMVAGALVVLGLAIGFVIAFIWGAGSTTPNLPVGLLLVIAGVIVGFVIEWLIDESVRKNRELQRQLEDHQRGTPVLVEGSVINRSPGESEVLVEVLRQLQELKATPPPPAPPAVEAGPPRRQESETLVEVLRQHNEELNKLSQQIAEKDIEVEYLRRKHEAYQRSHPDELTHVKGIGPVFQRKLRDIGFHSFEDLAKADPAQIRRMLDIKSWQKVDIESWVQQAKDWAEHN